VKLKQQKIEKKKFLKSKENIWFLIYKLILFFCQKFFYNMETDIQICFASQFLTFQTRTLFFKKRKQRNEKFIF